MSNKLIVMTFVDRRYEQFVRLATFEFETIEKLHHYWSTVPDGPKDSVFTADLHEDDGLTQTREIPFDWIQQITGATIQDLIAIGRAETKAISVSSSAGRQRPPHAVRG